MNILILHNLVQLGDSERFLINIGKKDTLQMHAILDGTEVPQFWYLVGNFKAASKFISLKNKDNFKLKIVFNIQDLKFSENFHPMQKV